MSAKFGEPTISRELMIKAGYKEWKPHHYQKLISDDEGKRYFINCTHTIIDNTIDKHSHWSFDMQLETLHGNVFFSTVQWFNWDGRYTGRTIKDVEWYFSKLWIQHDRPYYERRDR